MRYALIAAVVCALSSSHLAFAADDPTRVFDKPVVDARTELIRSLHEGSGFKPYTDKSAWQQRAASLRQQVLISAGLWPMPEKCPLSPVIHGRIDRDGYTIEKVYFQSYPGFYVTGNLYRPTGRQGPFPAVLSPHGHWANGRLYETPDKEIAKQLQGGWETDRDAAKYPLQARAANLAKLGCIVFFYDMVGYADAAPKEFPHRQTYRDVDSDLHGLSIFGLQTWDSIRALDFVESLPDVDKTRLACTGASGGATQTFILMTIEDRLAAAAPVSMISAGEHQGGCVCENNSLLRVGTDNVELAATFAPRPFVAPTNTGDWTKDFLEHGFPEIQATYRLFNADQNVESYRQEAGHNYNRRNREIVYNFFNKHLKLGVEGAIAEQKFVPVPPKELSVWDTEHPRPTEAVDAEGLKKYFVAMTAKQIEAMKPTDSSSLERFRQMMGPAVQHLLSTRLPEAADVISEAAGTNAASGVTVEALKLRRKDDAQAIPVLRVSPKNVAAGAAAVTVLVLPNGKRAAFKQDGTPAEPLASLLRAGHVVLLPDVFGVGELSAAAPPAAKPVEFVAGYNRTTLANRVHDVLTTVTSARATSAGNAPAQVNLVGIGDAGPWCLLARGLAGDAIGRTVADAGAIDFEAVKSATDANYLPHSLRYGGLWPMAALGAPGKLVLSHLPNNEPPAWLKAAYGAAGQPQNLRVEHELTPEQMVKALAP